MPFDIATGIVVPLLINASTDVVDAAITHLLGRGTTNIQQAVADAFEQVTRRLSTEAPGEDTRRVLRQLYEATPQLFPVGHPAFPNEIGGALIIGATGALRDTMWSLITPYLSAESPDIQEQLRGTLPSALDEAFAALLRQPKYAGAWVDAQRLWIAMLAARLESLQADARLQHERERQSLGDLLTRLEALATTPVLLISADSITREIADALLADLRRPGGVLPALLGHEASVTLERALGSPAYGPDEILEACRRLTRGVARRVLMAVSGHVARRPTIDAGLHNFLQSDVPLGILHGAFGTGKTTFVASAANERLDAGWAVLVVRGTTWSLTELASHVATILRLRPVMAHWSRVLIDPWNGPLPDGVQGLLVVVEGVERPATSYVSDVLSEFLDAAAEVPPGRIKALVSCDDLAWDDLQEHAISTMRRDIATIEAGDFDGGELDEALSLIKVEDLRSQPRPGYRPDPHSAAVRSLLAHPATFGVYAEVKRRGAALPLEDLTWSGLLDRYVRAALRRAGQRCGKRGITLQNMAIALAKLLTQQEARDGRLDGATIDEALPGLQVNDLDPTRSPYAALREQGLLQEWASNGIALSIGFRQADAASYLLSLDLEHLAQQGVAADRDAYVATVVQGASIASPIVVDALLAWIDRLAAHPENPTLHLVLEKVIWSYPFRTAVLFRLLRPSVVTALFAMVGAQQPVTPYPYINAAKAVRPTEHTREEVKAHLGDANHQVRLMAIELAGAYRDATSVPLLLASLRQDDEAAGAGRFDRDAADRYLATMRTLAHIGAAAANPLLDVAADRSQPMSARMNALRSLREVGYRDERVSAALCACLAEGEATEPLLYAAALQTAAELRDTQQAEAAAAALTSERWEVVWAAARFYCELLNTADPVAIHRAIDAWFARTDAETNRLILLLELVRALARHDSQIAKNMVAEFVRSGLEGDDPLRKTLALRATLAHNVAEGYRVLVATLPSRLEQAPMGIGVWNALRSIGAAWTPEVVDACAAEAVSIMSHGVDIASAVGNAIVAGIRTGGDHPVADGETGIAALDAMVICQPPTLAHEVVRLLPHADRHLAVDFCDVLWIVGDSHAENGLVAALNRTLPEGADPHAWIVAERAMRALGSCATERSAEAIMHHLRTSTYIEDSRLPCEALYPLARRGIVTMDQLSEIAADPGASRSGRAACLVTLGLLYQSHNHATLREVAIRGDDLALQGVALASLRGNDEVLAADVVAVLRTTEDPYVAGRSALALARMGRVDAVPLMEQCLGRFAPRDGCEAIVMALEYLGVASSLPILLAVLPGCLSLSLRYSVLEALGAFLPADGALRTLAAHLDPDVGMNSLPGDQIHALRGMERNVPLLALHAARLYQSGRLDDASVEYLARRLPSLIAEEDNQETSLRDLLRWLSCDQRVTVREPFLQALAYRRPTVFRLVHNALDQSGDEWERSCAIYMLGFRNDAADALLQGAGERLSRYMADRAVELRWTRRMLDDAVERFATGTGVERAASYQRIAEHGDEQIVWRLSDSIPADSPALIFLQRLGQEVISRLERERERRGRAERDMRGREPDVGIDWDNGAA